MGIREHFERSQDQIRIPFAVVKSRIRFILVVFVSQGCFLVIRGACCGVPFVQRRHVLRGRHYYSTPWSFPEPNLDSVACG